MAEWYDMPGALDDIESHPAYLEKLAIDAEAEETKDVILAREKAKERIVCSWIKKTQAQKENGSPFPDY